MEINFNHFYMMQFVQIINYIILYTVLIQPLRFSRKKTCMIVSICFFMLYLPQLVFPSFFHTGIDSNTAQFVINIIYWTLYTFFTYMIIIFIAKRNWLYNFFFIIVWDLIASSTLILLLPLQYFLPNIEFFLELISSIFSIFIIQKFLRCRIQLSQKSYKIFFVIYTIIQFLLTLCTLSVNNTTSEFILLGTVFFISVSLLSAIFFMNHFLTNYINQKCGYYQNLFELHPYSANWNRFLSYLQNQYQCSNISFDFHNRLPDSYFSNDHSLYYLLILCNQILLKKSKKKNLSNVYLTIQQQMNYTIISTGYIQTESTDSIRWTDELSVSFDELLLHQLLKMLHGQVQFLDESTCHKQIQIVYLT